MSNLLYVKRIFSLTVLALLVFALVALPQQAMAQHSDKDCQALMKQINDLVDRLPGIGERMGRDRIALDSPHASAETRNSLQNTLKTDESTIRSLKGTIDKLMEKLCACCGKSSEQTGKSQPTPTPSTTDRVTDVLKTIGGSVSIGIGGGGHTSGHDEHHHGEDRHRTAEKVPTDKTKTHTASPTTTHKTVTSACKCHPCTCSPCTCH